MGEVETGTIIGLYGSWESGLAVLKIIRDDGIQDDVFCDNAPTVRAFDAAFDDVIGESHTINSRALRGKRISYSKNWLGILEGFTPLEEN